MLSIDKLTTVSEANRISARQLVDATLESHEKLMRVNLDATQDLLKTGGEQLKEAYGEMARFRPEDAWPTMMINLLRRGTAHHLSLIEVTKRMQRDFACAVEENLRVFRDGSLDVVEKLNTATQDTKRRGRNQATA